MFLILETLIGLILAGAFGAQALGHPRGNWRAYADTLFFNPLKKLLSPRFGRAIEDKIFVWAAFALGLWMAIPMPASMDRWPAFALIMIFLISLSRAGKDLVIDHDATKKPVAPVATGAVDPVGDKVGG